MQWQVGAQGWPIMGGAILIPASTVLTGPPPIIWQGITLPVDADRPMPIDSISIDQAAMDQMRVWYSQGLPDLPDRRHRLLKGPGVT
jgi:hypothetical protein